MRFKTLIAVAVAGAFAVPFAALAQGSGGSTTAPSATSDSASWDKLDRNHDGYLSREELKNDAALSGRFGEMDTNNDGRISKSEFEAAASGSGATTPGSSSSDPSKTMGTPKSPSSGGASSGNSTGKEPK
jgi:hypothetical protein